MKGFITTTVALILGASLIGGLGLFGWIYTDGKVQDGIGTALRITRPQAGGTGTSTAPTADQILIGGDVSNAYDVKTLTAGTNITISTSSQAVTISSTGGGSSFFGDLSDVATSSDATGDVYYLNASGQIVNLGIGTPGQVLEVAAGGIPEWDTDDSTAGGGDFAWTPVSDGNATSTTLLFNQGFISAASSTISANATTTGTHNFDSGVIVNSTLITDFEGTNLSVTGGTLNATGGSGTFSWTPTTNYGALTNATTTPVWFQNGFQASTTAYLVFASSTAITAVDFFGALTGNADTATALAGNGGNCVAGSYSLGVDASGASEDCTDATTEIDSAIATHTSNATAHQALVTLAGTPNYLTLSGQEITMTVLDISDDTNLLVTYPITLTDDTVGIAFGTTTANTWANLQTFTSGISVNGVTITDFEGTGLSVTTNTLNIDFTEFDTDDITQGATNKYNVSHTGEVTGATNLNIANGVIDEVNIDINAPTDNYLMVASSSTSGGWEWVATTSANIGLVQTSDLHDAVTVSGTPNYITLSGQDIVRAKLDISDDTNATGGVGVDITANDFTIDLNELGVETAIAAGDFIGMVDITDSGSQKITFANFEGDLSLGNLLGDSDDITQGATNLYNQTHTGEVTGATALTIASAVVDSDNIINNTIVANDISTTTTFLDGEYITYVAATDNFTSSTCAEITGSADLCDGNDAVGSGSGNVGTSTTPTIGQVPYWTTSGADLELLGSVATTTLTAGTNVTFDGTPGYLIGGTNLTINATGGGGTFSWTPDTYAGTLVNATSTGLWLKATAPFSLVASSTFATYASSTDLTNSGNTWFTALSAGGLGIDANNLVYSGATTTAGTGLTYSGNAFNVDTSQNIATLSNLTDNGFVVTTGGGGALSIDTSTYLTGNQTITLSGDVTGSGATAITTAIDLGVIVGNDLSTTTVLADGEALVYVAATDNFTTSALGGGRHILLDS